MEKVKKNRHRPTAYLKSGLRMKLWAVSEQPLDYQEIIFPSFSAAKKKVTSLHRSRLHHRPFLESFLGSASPVEGWMLYHKQGKPVLQNHRETLLSHLLKVELWKRPSQSPQEGCLDDQRKKGFFITVQTLLGWLGWLLCFFIPALLLLLPTWVAKR